MAPAPSHVWTAALAAYLPFEGPDLRYVYGLFGAFVVLFLVMAAFRGLARLREARQVQRSSWKTFSNVAKVKGLSRIEIQIVRRLFERHSVKRPTQALGSIVTYDRLIDQALDRGWIEDDEQGHLDRIRQKLVRTSQVWDGRTNRRELERAPCSFELGVTVVSKEDIDEELKAAYDEGDEKFAQAVDGLVGERRPENTRVIDLSAGGTALLAADKDQVHAGDYLAFAAVDEAGPIDLSAIRGRVLDVERMEDQHQLVLHVRFLPYDAELRKQVIRAVYEEAERAAAAARVGKEPARAKAKSKSKSKAKPKAKAKPKPKSNPKSSPEAAASSDDAQA